MNCVIDKPHHHDEPDHDWGEIVEKLPKLFTTPEKCFGLEVIEGSFGLSPREPAAAGEAQAAVWWVYDSDGLKTTLSVCPIKACCNHYLTSHRPRCLLVDQGYCMPTAKSNLLRRCVLTREAQLVIPSKLLESNWSHCRDVPADLHISQDDTELSQARFRIRKEIFFL